MRKEIWLVKHDSITDKPSLEYFDSGAPYAEITERDAGASATAEDLANLCDRDAENCNAHDFVGVHRLLGALLYRRHGRVEATATLLRIVELGGLHGMTGLCDREDAYAELGVGECGSDWFGSFG